MKVSVLQHAADEGPGEIKRWAEDHGHATVIHHLYRGDALPELTEFDLLVVMGGEMNIYQDRDYPWLKPERFLVAETMRAGKRVIGICLGSQLIADALGVRVTQNPAYEIGWFPVRFTPEAQLAIPGLPETSLVLHWHGDTYDLPSQATRLANSEACPEQGFLIAGKCLALQFHLEVDADLARQMVEGSSDFAYWPKGPYVQTPAKIIEQAPKACVQTRAILYRLLDAFCET